MQKKWCVIIYRYYHAVVLQSLTAIPVAKLLGVRQPSPNTILIIGANHVSRSYK
ncbi:hypothetical protein P4S68_18145 [Pseudoalteromonas sp. Hal099]